MTTKTNIVISAVDKTKQASQSVYKNMRRVANEVLSVKTAVASLAGAAGMGLLISKEMEAAQQATVYARALKVSVEQMTAWQFAARTVNVEADKMSDIFKDVSEKIGDAFANGGGEAKEVLERLNIDIREMAQLSPDKQLLRVAAGLSQVGTQAEKVQVMEALASDASLLLPLLENNAAGLIALKKEAVESGNALNAIDAENLNRANQSLIRAQGVISGLSRQFVAGLAPYLEFTANWFLENAKQAGGMGKVAQSALQVIGNGIGYVITGLEYMQIGWETVRLGVLAFAAVSLKALESLVSPIRHVNELLGRDQPEAIKFLTHLVGDFEQASIDGQARLMMLISGVGSGAEATKQALISVKETAESVSNIGLSEQVEAPEIAAARVAAAKAAELEQIKIANSLALLEEQAYQDQLVEEAKKRSAERVGYVSETLNNLGTLIGAKSRKLFNMGKAASIASALVNTYEAVTKTMSSTPYPFNVPLAAAQAAAGAVQVQKIKSQSYSGAREFGGPVVRNRSYLVGERGPEVFTPQASGNITANKDISGGNITFAPVVYANDSQSFEDQVDRSFAHLWNRFMDRMNEEGRSFA